MRSVREWSSRSTRDALASAGSVVEHGKAEAPQVVVEVGRIEVGRIERPLRESLDLFDALPVLGV